jgi:hypothetical protein
MVHRGIPAEAKVRFSSCSVNGRANKASGCVRRMIRFGERLAKPLFGHPTVICLSAPVAFSFMASFTAVFDAEMTAVHPAATRLQ